MYFVVFFNTNLLHSIIKKLSLQQLIACGEYTVNYRK